MMFGDRACRVCGCQQERACVEVVEAGAHPLYRTCAWSDVDLCSACAGSVTLSMIRSANLYRTVQWGELVENWSLADWAVAAAGEMGEACNIVKKLNRVRDGLAGNRESEDELKAKLADELADTLAYLDLTAARAGIDLAAAYVKKFNEVSSRRDSPIRLTLIGGEP